MPKIVSLCKNKIRVNAKGFISADSLPKCKSLDAYIKHWYALNHCRGEVDIVILPRDVAEQLELSQFLNGCA